MGSLHTFISTDMASETEKHKGKIQDSATNSSITCEEEQSMLKTRFLNHEFVTLFGNIPNLPDKLKKSEEMHTQRLVDFNLTPICTRLDISSEEFFIGCFALTLQQYLGQNNVSFCIPVANETDDNNSILPIISTIPDVNVKEFFSHVKQEISLFKKFSSISFSKLLQEMNVNDASNLYLHMFSYNQDSLQKKSYSSKRPKAGISLEVCKEINGNGFFVTVSWAKHLLQEQPALFFLQNFLNCCQNVIKSSDVTFVKSIDIINAEEKSLLTRFEKISCPSSSMKYRPLMEHFDNNVMLNPNKIAVHESNMKFTYAQLQSASNDIASALLQKFPNISTSTDPVALVMEKDFYCIASVLGVWRAGGFILPIDSNMQERITQSSISFTCVLTNLHKNELLNNISSEMVMYVYDLVQNKSVSKIAPVLTSISQDSPAYMTMTSGSTGVPKRCINTHGGLFTFMTSAQKQFNLQEDTNLLQWVPFSFDVFIGDLIKALFCTNGSMTMVIQLDRFNIDKLSYLTSEKGVNFIHMTPQFAMFALQQNPNLMQGVKTLALGGESLEWKTLQNIQERLPRNTRIFNCYGLTEATVESTALEISTLLPEEIEFYKKNCTYVPIGKPFAEIQIRIINAETHLSTPFGVPGILSISGPTLGTGDISTKLIDGERTYLTGDTASWLPNGCINFIGRDETQTLKVRGLRINCHEMEHAIMTVGQEVELAVALTVDIGEDVVLVAAIQTCKIDTENLKNKLRNVLPYYMVPQLILSINKFPLTPNGKIDRKALKVKAQNEYNKILTLNNSENKTMTKVEEYLVNKLSEASGRLRTSILFDNNLRDQGFTSLQLLKFSNLIMNDKLKNFDGISDIFTYPTISLLATKLDSQSLISAHLSPIVPVKDADDPICIVGMSFRLPGNITTIPDFWSHLNKGTCFVRDMPKLRSDDVLTRMSNPFKSGCVRASFFDRIDQFDHEIFKIAPNEAKHMCPEQRQFLEVATEALVDAGMNLSSIDGKNIGVYATATDIEYGLIDKSLDGVAVVGRQSSVVPSRVTYTYNLKGGNYVVDTACSAALIVLEQAVRDLKAGQCDSAIVGGVNIYLYPAQDGLMGTNLIHSPSSTCMAFDESADGTASGEGCFAYVLKRVSDARSNGDYIYSTIESCCSNAVGRGNGITAPSVDSQVTVIQNAISQAGLTVDDIDFLETHGTGTVLGDQIELCSLASVFQTRESPLPVGVSKPNFGHLDMAAGFLSILKATSALTFNASPPMRHIKKASKYLDPVVFSTSSNKIVKSDAKKAYAGLSAYGLSGTNCHAIISIETSLRNETTNNSGQEDSENCNFLLQMDSEQRSNFEHQCKVYLNYLEFYSNSTNSLEDICGTQINNLVNLGRKSENLAVISVSSLDDLKKQLHSLSDGISLVSADKLCVLNTREISKLLPTKWNRVPAFPKFFFKNFRHWLNPVKQVKLNIPNTNLQIQSFLQTKMSECNALLEAARTLEQLMNKFSFDVLTDLVNSTSHSVPKSSNDNIFGFPETTNNSKIPDKTVTETIVQSHELVPLNNLTNEKVYKIIEKIWFDCLGCDRINSSDIFRDLGGDSLLTVQMTKLVSKTFNCNIKAADAFPNPSLSTFTAFVFNTVAKQQNQTFLLGTELVFNMPMKMIMFPGQGSQKVNMCTTMLSNPAAHDLIQEASKITRIDIISNLTKPDAFLNTEFVQICLFVGSLAKIEQLKVESPETLQDIRAVAGLSAGEFAALVFSEAIDFSDALKIVQFRGKAMQDAIDTKSSTGMVSVFGPTADAFGEWMKNNFNDMRFCTFLGDNQFTVGGPLESCKRLEKLLTTNMAEQLGIVDARLLRVAGAFHTEYMKEAAKKTAELIDALNINFPKYGIVMNFDGQVAMNKESIRFNLKKQTASAVLWKESMITAYELGVRSFIEISPSSVLTPILKSRIKSVHNCECKLVRF